MALSAQTPALLVPVRLETRFADGEDGPELQVRIFPDQISIDTHEPGLTEAEEAAGRTHWDVIWRAGTGEGGAAVEKAAWQGLAAAYGPERAAWIARRTEPENLAQRPVAATDPQESPSPVPSYPELAASERSEHAWERAPLARGLPDRWLVAGYVDGDETHRALSEPVRRPLAVGPDPSLEPPQDPSELQVDAGMRWMVDFEEAEAAGMAIRLPLTEAERERGFDRLVAVGLSSTGAPEAPMLAAAAIVGPGYAATEPTFAALLEAHRHTDGLALLPQGTPTNNTEGGPTGYSRHDPGFERSFAVERGSPLELADGRVVAAALGVPAEAFAHIEHADRQDQASARAMADALWPATLGYFLHNMMSPVFGPEDEEWGRRWFVENVRARGPVPALRIGDVPYGVLPITSLASWDRGDERERGLATFLRRALPLWLASAEEVPRAGRPESDPGQELIDILTMDASSRSYRGRPVLGDEFLYGWRRWLEISGEHVPAQTVGRELLDRYGYAHWEPRVTSMSLADVSYEVSRPLTEDGPPSETEPLATVDMDGTAVNYISWLRRATVDDLREERYPGGEPPNTLLYAVLRQAVLLEYASVAFELHVEAGTMTLEQTVEPEFIGFQSHADVLTAWDALGSAVAAHTGEDTVAQYIDALPDPEVTLRAPGRGPAAVAGLQRMRVALERLAELPTAELERLFTETLDATSHRLDAWITSLAQRVLRERFQEAESTGAPAPCHLGAFGVVLDLRPAERRQEVSGAEAAAVEALNAARRERAPAAPEPPPAREPAEESGGFVHAPSPGHAAAAAVLRSGYLSDRGDGADGPLSIDLSSERVRTALALADGVRAGQSLATLLGYRFERGLRAGGLSAYTEAFRARYPLVADRLTPSDDPPDRAAAPNVVDGEALYRAHIEGGIEWGDGLPPAGPDRNAAVALLEELRDAMDALSDLSIAESVYQLIHGNYTRAGALLDAISRAERPVEPEIVTASAPGIDVTHRLLLLMTGSPARSQAWPGEALPRARAEPRLDSWLTTALPRADQVRCEVTYVTAQNAHETLAVTLEELGVGPLDLLAMSHAADQPQESELEQRVLYAALAKAPAGASAFELSFKHSTSFAAGELVVPELLVAARALRDMVAAARPLRPEDLVPPGWEVDQDTLDSAELATRATAAVQAVEDAHSKLEAALDDLDPDDHDTVRELRDRLFDASFTGAAGAVPAVWEDWDDTALARLEEQAGAVVAELQGRRKAAGEITVPAGPPDEVRDRLVDRIHAALGADLQVLPRFEPPEDPDLNLHAAFDQSSSLVADDADAPARWYQQLTHVRPGVAHHDAARTAVQLAGGARPPALTLGQLPVQQGDRWLALPIDPSVPPTSGRLAFAAELPLAYDPDEPHSGLLLDAWPEAIPLDEVTTGVAFHHDQPSNRAPQSLLLAVCPDERPHWDPDLLLEIVGEAVDLARIRAVDPETLQEAGQILPPLYFAFNPDGQTVSGKAEAIIG